MTNLEKLARRYAMALGSAEAALRTIKSVAHNLQPGSNPLPLIAGLAERAEADIAKAMKEDFGE